MKFNRIFIFSLLGIVVLILGSCSVKTPEKARIISDHNNIRDYLVVTGVIKCDGYHIEKLYYESLPGLYVPANLYVPDSIKTPVPAILYVCSHFRRASA